MLVIITMVLLTVSLAAPAPASPQASQAPPAAPNVPELNLSASTDDPNPSNLIDAVNGGNCRNSTFVDETNGSSPKAEDCLAIAKNIAAGGHWEIESVTGKQHQLVQWGTCAFGVKLHHLGDPLFYVGNQDIIDIIHTSIQLFGSSGLLGASGLMWCGPGTVESPGVDWSIYHDNAFQPRELINDTVPDFTTPTDDPLPATFFPANVNEEYCGDSTFVDETTDASPFVDDCLVILKNIAEKGRWLVEAVVGNQHQLVQWGTCAFGAQGKSSSAGGFYIGNGDITDIINDSIQKFGRNGRVGSKGSMSCSGLLTRSVNANWGLYHTKSKSSLPRQIQAASNTTVVTDPSTNPADWATYHDRTIKRDALTLGDPDPNITAADLPAPNTTAPRPVFSTPPHDTQAPTFLGPPNGNMPQTALDGNNECGASTFMDQWSPASPLIDDCLRIVANIGAGGKWEIESTAKSQHQLVQYGTCALGVQGLDGIAFFFYVGNQDIIDLIHESIRRFGREGLVQTAGEMSCSSGVSRPPSVGWGIYHTR